MQNDRNFWNRCARFYTNMQERKSKNLYIKIAERIEIELDSDMSVLELGCGTGQLSLPLAPLVKKWTATDFSSNMITELKKRTIPNNLYLSVQDATHLPYDSNEFDVVVIANTLHIMPEPEKALQETYRVLKQGGLLIAPTFIKDEHQKRWKLWFIKRIGFRIYNNWTAKDFSMFVKQFHFLVESTQLISADPSTECLLIARRRKSS